MSALKVASLASAGKTAQLRLLYQTLRSLVFGGQRTVAQVFVELSRLIDHIHG